MGSLSVVVACGGLVHCGGIVGKPVDGDGEPERAVVDLGITRRGADEAAELTFPPDDRMRTRPAIADEFRRHGDRALRIVEPELSDGSVVIDAKTLEIAFNQPIRGASAGAPAGGKLRITDPSEALVTGLATWKDDRTLRFEATRFLDPAKRYALTLTGVESTSGRTLGEQKLTLRTRSGGIVGGKAIGHVPEPGKYRVVVLGADDGMVVSQRPQLGVLFDQPISLEAARKLVKLTDAQGNLVPVSIRHASSRNWRGVAVNPQFVAVATPLTPLARQGQYTLRTEDHPSVDGPQAHSAKIEVADDLSLTGVECSWWKRDDEICDVAGDTVRTNRNEIHLRFNNQIGLEGKALARHVAVTPAVRNLQIVNERWGGRIVMTGDFRPSVRYRVTATGLSDVFHQSLPPLSLNVEIQPLGASIAMPEGLLSLDEANTKRFEVTSRNVAKAKLSFWRVPEDDVAVFNKALGKALSDHPELSNPDKTLSVDVAAKQNELVTTQVDLSQAIDASASWLVTVEATEMAFSAAPLKFPEGSAAAKPPVALLKPYGSDNLAVHAHSAPGITIVQVSRLGSGAPVKGATVSIDTVKAVSDDNGVAVLAGDTTTSGDAVVKVTQGAHKALLPLARPVAVASELFPDMARGQAVAGNLRGFVVTDRGIYRPGAEVGIKGNAFVAAGTGLSPKKNQDLALRLLGPTGEEVCRAEGKTGELGGIATRCALPADAKLGLHRVELQHAREGVIAESTVRVADFEPPKFKVDVEARSTGKTIAADVVAKYLFGSPMKGAHVQWSLTREPADLPSGVHSDAGLSFRPEPSWFDDEDADKWSRTGEGVLDDGGKLAVTQAVAFDGVIGPQRFTLEADVSDESYRHVANRQDVVVHPAPRYAGLRGPRGWVGVDDDVEVQLGVADRDGKAVAGARVSAHLREVSWRYIDRRGPGGSITSEWRRSEREVGSCSVVSGDKPKRCTLSVPGEGDYRVVAEVDGREGGSSWFWAWGGGSNVASATPTRGNVVQVLSDKPHYKPGDTARLIVRNPYPAATAIVTTQMGAQVTHQSKRLSGAAAMFEIPIREAHAPHVHATVTLLPIGAKGRDAASYRIGAARLPVTLAGSRLAVSVHSDRTTYKPGEKVTVTMRVTDGGKPEGKAEIALAVVDEGVLRLTDFHAADPVPALRPPLALDFALRDSRAGLMALLEQSHVAGDGGGEEQGSMPHTRRRFVNTALWEPSVRTDEAGVAEVSFTLPDNLTEWRMMAVAVDAEGKGGNAEQSFEVRKEIMLSAVMPRFAHVGDQLELAALLHNGSDRDFVGTVVVDGQQRAVTVAAGARQRVAVPFAPAVTEQREVEMSVRDQDGVVVDALSEKLRVSQPGYAVHPTLAGVFQSGRSIDLRIPDAAMVAAGATLEVKLGEHLWPELGKRMEYLLDYPHGCVEQTTSSTLPLIAARDIFPRIGLDHHGDGWFRERIEHGIKRLASMRTSSGGLAYWPGDATPNAFGTAYAMRAVVRAHQGGIALPPGMLSGMARYLTDALLEASTEPDLRAAIAESLAMLDGGLPPGIADTLFELREGMSDFGRASLLIALSSMPEQRDRVRTMVAELTAHYDARGRVKDEHVSGYRYWGSQLRNDAQAAIALLRSDPKSLLARQIVENIAGAGGAYTTQTTAWGLLAVSDHLKALPPSGAPVAVALDGIALEPHRELPGGAREYRIPLAPLVGKAAKLSMSSGESAFIGYTLRADYRLPLTPAAADAQGVLVDASGEKGPDLYRILTTPEGDPIDPSNIAAGQIVRVALLAEFSGYEERSYLALTDRLPAGFAPVEQDLASTASAPGIHEQHPLSGLLRWNDHSVSHMEMHDDSVQIYFDHIYGERVAATYLARATTPGRFAQPPAVAELMYQPDSTSYTAGEEVVIR